MSGLTETSLFRKRVVSLSLVFVILLGIADFSFSCETESGSCCCLVNLSEESNDCCKPDSQSGCALDRSDCECPGDSDGSLYSLPLVIRIDFEELIHEMNGLYDTPSPFFNIYFAHLSRGSPANREPEITQSRFTTLHWRTIRLLC